MMAIKFDYALCTAGMDETPELELVAGKLVANSCKTRDFPEVVAVPPNDFLEYSDAKLDEEIHRFQMHIQSADLKLKDRSKLEVRLRALETEKANRNRARVKNITQSDHKRALQQSSARGSSNVPNSSLTDSANHTARSAKERRTADFDPDPSAPAFQKELAFHRFTRRKKQCSRQSVDCVEASGKGSGESCRSPTDGPDRISTVQELTPDATTRSFLGLATEKASTAAKTSRGRGRSAASVGGTPDSAVVVFSSDDESCELSTGFRTVDSKCTRRKSPRIAEQRRLDLDLKIAYPSRDDPDAVEVHYRDLNHLKPMEFLNDTMIDFYIKYLQRPEFLEPDRQARFYFFNSFFFKKLTEAFDTEARQKQSEAFSKLRKWTKGVDIFEKCYLFVPINDKFHWSLAIVCFSMPECNNQGLIPYIFHLDSLENGHLSRDIFKYLRRYLEVEHEHTESAFEINWNDIVTRRVEVPRQENEYDCGLFLLYYIKRFVETAPLPCKLTQTANLFGKRWFRPGEASMLRGVIKETLQRLFEDTASG